jgi:polysaccharide pyruvyl transferase WcaK-like protein
MIGRLLDQLRRVDTDTALMGSMAGLIELAATRYALDAGAQWRPGEPLKLLFAGYAGTRNTGADVRVEEMIRQVRHLLGDDLADLSILTIDPASSRGYFKTVKQLHLPQIFPKFVFDTVHQQHGVIACEGSMFKSKFANALSTLMVGALGVASAENKIAIGYGGEAGAMDEALEALVRRYLPETLIITRNEESRNVLGRLGVQSRLGTDTAWTFDVPLDRGQKMLEDAGWDGRTPVLAVCPINAFWWPVKPDLMRGAAWALSGAHEEAHYDSVYFHHSGSEVDQAQKAYIGAIAAAIRRFRTERAVFPVLVGMEKLDRSACVMLDEMLGGETPIFVSDEHDMYAMVSLIRSCSMLVSSRYHAIVCSMPGGVPSAGITMDERIANLMVERGTPELSLKVDDPGLADDLYQTLNRLHRESDAIRQGIGLCVARNVLKMGVMGGILVDRLRERHPELPIRAELGEGSDPHLHLPPLGPRLRALLETYTEAA